MQLIEKIDNRALQIVIDNFDYLFDHDKLGRFVLPSKNYCEVTDKKTILTTLKNLLKSKKTLNPTVSYKYSKGMENRGRKFSDGASLQTISRVIRHTVAKDIYWDLDIVNAHPCILLKYCEDGNLKCDAIKDYIENRPKHINDLVEKYNIDSDGAKKIYLSLINGASRYEKYPEKSIFLFEMEMKNILCHFVKTEEGSVFYKKAYDKKRSKSGGGVLYNVVGSAINLYFCKIENLLLESLCRHLVEMKYRIGTYCFDGVLVYQDTRSELNDEVLSELERFISQDTGYNISLKKKEMNEGIDLSGLKTDDEKDLELSERDVALYMIECIRSTVKYDKFKDLLYLYNDLKALWEVQKLDVLKNKIYDFTISYCEEKGLEMTKKMQNKIKSSSWDSQIFRKIVPLIYEKFDDSELIRTSFDKIKGLFPLACNKVIDLKTLTVRDRTPVDYFTKTTDNEFQRQFNLEGVESYVKSLLMTDSKDYIEYFLGSVAYSLTGENNLKRFFILNGKRDGGKSLFIQVLNSIFQDWGGFINDKVFKQSRNESVHNTEVFSLTEKRLGNVSELEEKDRFNEPLLKKITGGDPLNIRACGSDKNIEVNIDTVLWLSTNEIPKFSDEAFCGRMRVFLFKNRFSFDQEKRDWILGLKRDLFIYLCHLAKKYYDNKMTLPDIEEVLAQTNEVIQSKNSAIQFFNERMERTSSASDRIGKVEMYKAYSLYCTDMGMDNVGRNKFYQTMVETFNLKVFRDRQFTNVKPWGQSPRTWDELGGSREPRERGAPDFITLDL